MSCEISRAYLQVTVLILVSKTPFQRFLTKNIILTRVVAKTWFTISQSLVGAEVMHVDDHVTLNLTCTLDWRQA